MNGQHLPTNLPPLGADSEDGGDNPIRGQLSNGTINHRPATNGGTESAPCAAIEGRHWFSYRLCVRNCWVLAPRRGKPCQPSATRWVSRPPPPRSPVRAAQTGPATTGVTRSGLCGPCPANAGSAPLARDCGRDDWKFGKTSLILLTKIPRPRDSRGGRIVGGNHDPRTISPVCAAANALSDPLSRFLQITDQSFRDLIHAPFKHAPAEYQSI
jgi:hypothetical protein